MNLLPETIERKQRAGLCITAGCANNVREARTKCNTCRNRQYDDPLRRLFRNKKSDAKRRGIRFALSFDEFMTWAKETGYDKAHGPHAGDMTIDRVDPWDDSKGYCLGNIKTLTRKENCEKQWLDIRQQRESGDPF